MDTKNKLTPTYTPSNFRKQQSKLLKQVANNNSPIRVTLPNKGEGPNQDLFVISAQDYAEYQRLKGDYMQQIDHEIGEMSDAMLHKKTTNAKEVEEWLRED
ncbi:Hypothetical protein ADU72_0498 [Pediococcus damnosus]|uniref:Antitoxin n=1 Tax=Pediococcus damnosus TaxID=51663 RepID=A0A0R2HN69_9LACO|nr:hypothetical protein [Pediococcus damnosus]AMV61046.1 Hypothetical protein ADU69_1393 [Pediococcus damnosus]AMV63614.1 Hypothetical protein ADU70_2150 [Pediococcus damnosus]AMV65406.1 Hypothetical protein ADU71_1514 [Pediococcus damnosus]AMV66445.1 Hypothetical protein ADU72_0498 [Pediococcus damnosus]AMV68747.1 Hypothetical protein ADU73_0337 [Pediococcus damnosus]